MNTIYDYIVDILGDPAQAGEYGPYVAYVVAGFIFIFIVYMLLNMILGVFRWIWGR